MIARLRRQPIAPIALATLSATLALLGPLAPVRNLILTIVLGIAGLASALYIGWRIHPAWTLSGALLLSVMAGNWSLVGVPGQLAPDRLLFAAGIMAVLLRAPPVRDRPRLRFSAVHWVMLVALLWALGSAVASGTIYLRGDLFEILERFGVVPFLLFLVSPVVFATERDRRILVAALVALGAYLGFTALMETLGVKPLVFPSIINDPTVGIHADRARGPFLEAVTNGAGLFAGIVGAGLAVTTWRGRNARIAAGSVLLLCSLGLLFTETRSVWLGGLVAGTIVLVAVRELHRFILPVVGAVLASVVLALTFVPGLADTVRERRNQKMTVWDRKNLAVAAVNMVEAKPLVGEGWGRFTIDSQDYFRESQDYPLTANRQIIHNVFLTYAAEIGLVGLGLWTLALLLGMARALRPSSGRDAFQWRVALGAYFLFFLVISNFVFAQVFPNDMLWLLAGTAVGAGGTARAVGGGLTSEPEPDPRALLAH